MSLREIVRVSQNTRVFLTRRLYTADKIVKCFGEAVRIQASSTFVGIESCLEVRLHCDTDPNVINDELRAGIMRIILGKISETQATISNTAPPSTS